MLALAEKFSQNVALDAMALGISVEEYEMWKRGFEETYRVVDETFEKGYQLPNKKRKVSLKELVY